MAINDTGVALAAGLTTVADYASLPGTPTEGQAVLVTDREAVCQWNGASWVLLTAITVATVGALPSTGVANGDYAAVTTTPAALYLRSGGAWTLVSPVSQAVDPGLSTVPWDAFLRTSWLALGEMQSTTTDPGLSNAPWTVV